MQLWMDKTDVLVFSDVDMECAPAATAVRGRSGAAAPQLQPLHNIARFRLLPPLQASPGMAPLAARGVVRG